MSLEENGQGFMMKKGKFVLLSIIIILAFSCIFRNSILPNLNLVLPTEKSETKAVTIVSSQISTKTHSSIPIVTNTPFSNESISPSPTLSAKVLEQQILQLIDSNINCKLVCWWNTYPGRTNWKDANELLVTLGFTPKSFGNTITVSYSLPKEGFEIGLGIVYILDGEKITALYVGMSELQKNRITYTGNVYKTGLAQYNILQIHSTLGQPDKIEIRTYPWADEDGITPYVVLVNYNNQGFSIKYSGILKKEVSEDTICLNNSTLELFLWSPNLSKTNRVQTAYNSVFLDSEEYRGFRSLKESSGLEFDEFYDILGGSTNPDRCFEVTHVGWIP